MSEVSRMYTTSAAEAPQEQHQVRRSVCTATSSGLHHPTGRSVLMSSQAGRDRAAIVRMRTRRERGYVRMSRSTLASVTNSHMRKSSVRRVRVTCLECTSLGIDFREVLCFVASSPTVVPLSTPRSSPPEWSVSHYCSQR